MLRLILIVSVLASVRIAWAGVQEISVDSQPGGPIVGGTDADIREFPHQISMRYNGRHRCGGSIYSPNIIVTASHCVKGVVVELMTVVAGSTLLSEKFIEKPVLRIIMHEYYRQISKDNDVSILVLRGLLPFNDCIQPIPLAKERYPEGTDVIVTGWGYLVEGGTTPDHLQKVTVKVVDNDKCTNSILYTRFLSDRMMCAGVTGGGKDACQGDSGGPLIVGNELLGIVSWGKGCARENYLGVYASVPDLYDWIVTTAKAHTIEFA